MLLGNRYEVQERLHLGGMATVYRGHDLHEDRSVAIKILREVYSTDEKCVRHFQRNAESALSLQHPNIVQVYDWGETEGMYYTVMELVEGLNLRDYLQVKGVLDVDHAVRIACAIVNGLEVVHHRHLVYHVLTTRKILLGHDGSVKLAMVTTDAEMEQAPHNPPEQNSLPLTPVMDMYALGMVLYEMLTGRTP